jgi:ubiquinone biosynthesis protein Coq4
MQAASSEDFYGEGVRALTLGEALRRHYLLNPQFTVWSDYHSEIAKKLVKAHDISHLIFGCDTSLLGEMRVQLWAKFGVQKFGFKESLMYARDKEAKVLLKNPVGYWAMFLFFISHIGEVRQVRSQAKKMSAQWVYFEEDAYRTTTIGEIRMQLGIVVMERA